MFSAIIPLSALELLESLMGVVGGPPSRSTGEGWDTSFGFHRYLRAEEWEGSGILGCIPDAGEKCFLMGADSSSPSPPSWALPPSAPFPRLICCLFCIQIE